MSRIFEVFYTTTCDEYEQEHSSSRTIDAENEEQAESLVMYDLDKHYPNGENTIDKTKDITVFLKKSF